MDNFSPHGLQVGPGSMSPPFDRSPEGYPHYPPMMGPGPGSMSPPPFDRSPEGYPHYPHQPMDHPPMMGPEGNSIIPLEPHPPMSPPIPGPEGNLPMQPHPPMSPEPGPEENTISPMGSPAYPQLPPPDMVHNQPSAPPFFVGGHPPPPPHTLHRSFHNDYAGVTSTYPNPHNAVSFPQQMPQHFGYINPDHVTPNFRPQLSANSCQTTCPSCHFVVQTKVQKETGTRTHVAAIGMCLLLCWPFCLLPYFLESCKNANHYCPRCGTLLGSYKKKVPMVL